jgi:hypothetical protein
VQSRAMRLLSDRTRAPAGPPGAPDVVATRDDTPADSTNAGVVPRIERPRPSTPFRTFDGSAARGARIARLGAGVPLGQSSATYARLPSFGQSGHEGSCAGRRSWAGAACRRARAGACAPASVHSTAHPDAASGARVCDEQVGPVRATASRHSPRRTALVRTSTPGAHDGLGRRARAGPARRARARCRCPRSRRGSSGPP